MEYERIEEKEEDDIIASSLNPDDEGGPALDSSWKKKRRKGKVKDEEDDYGRGKLAIRGTKKFWSTYRYDSLVVLCITPYRNSMVS